MTDLLTFAGDHPIVSMLVVWSAAFTIRRIFRLVTIWIRGWPPPHCDADGDFRQEAWE